MGARATAGERWPLRTGISQLFEAGRLSQTSGRLPLELELARRVALRSRTGDLPTSVPGVRRGRDLLVGIGKSYRKSKKKTEEIEKQMKP